MWSVGIWHHHLVQQMLKNCSLVEGWWQPTTDLPYQEKSWTRFSFCEKTHWCQISILARYKKTFICIWTTKTINVWSKNHLRRCSKNLVGHNFDFRAKSSREKIFIYVKNFLSGGFCSKVKIVASQVLGTLPKLIFFLEIKVNFGRP